MTQGDLIHRLLEVGQKPEFANITPDHLVARFKGLKAAWKVLNDAHMEMLTLEGTDIETITERFIQSEQWYWDAYELYSVKVRAIAPDRMDVEVEFPPPQQQVIVNMPMQQHDIRNTWGEFDGSLLKWQGFHDRFKASVHDVPEISPAYKFQYLQKSLTGHAARTMGEWQLTADNYAEAWERLNQLYDKKYLISREWLRHFTRLPVLTTPARHNELQKMSNVTHETMRQLRAQGHPVEHWNMFIVHMLHERLDTETSKQWELIRTSDTPTAEEMLSFLDRQAAALAAVSAQRPGLAVTVPNERANRTEGQNTRSKRNEPSTSSAGASTNRALPTAIRPGVGMPCIACKSDHHIWKCPEFTSLSLVGKQRFIETNNLCANCLKRGHGVQSCFKGPCVRCPGNPPHNSLLCPNLPRQGGLDKKGGFETVLQARAYRERANDRRRKAQASAMKRSASTESKD